jgi:serine acetyltransferase
VKEIARKLAYVLAAQLGRAVPMKPMRMASRAFRRIYSAAVFSGFRQVGNDCRIDYPAVITGAKYISVGRNARIFARMRLEAFDRHLGVEYRPLISIGCNFSANFNCHIACIDRLVIGDDVLLASQVFISDHLHGRVDASVVGVPPSLRRLHSPGPVTIGDRVWLGENVVVLPNVTIGDDAIIGANAVVTRDVPPRSVVVGVPGRVIRTLC